MHKALVTTIIVVIGLLNLSAYSNDINHTNSIQDVMSKSEVRNMTYNSCIDTASEAEAYYMGFIKSEDDFKDFCGCVADNTVGKYVTGVTSRKEVGVIVEQSGYQCLKPYIQSSVINMCLKAAKNNHKTNVAQKCQCFGEQVAKHSSKDINRFFADSKRYLDYSAQYCRLKE